MTVKKENEKIKHVTLHKIVAWNVIIVTINLEEILLVNKLHLIFLFVLLIPQGVMFGMAHDSPLAANIAFSQIEAVSLASALMLAIAMPSVTAQWLVGKQLNRMRRLCDQVKQGNYEELLSLSNEPRNEEDDIITLMRDMNWMARRIAIREKDLKQATDDIWQSRNQMKEKNEMLLSVNAELLAVQERLKDRTIQLENSCRCMEVMAMTDPLTTIANRRCFFATLERQITEETCKFHPISLLIIDIDFFKKINDTYGHQGGDRVLFELAKSIQRNAREGDLVARIGGEEYAVLLPGTLSEQAVNIAKRIQAGIRELKFLLGENQVSVTVSIGISTLFQSLCCFDREKIYNYADQALYYSKENGRNSISVYHPDIHTITKVA